MTQSAAHSASGSSPLPAPKERRRLREAKSLTETQLATMLGVTGATIRAWETGRASPQGRKREAYAQLLAAFEAERAAPSEERAAHGTAPGPEAPEPTTEPGHETPEPAPEPGHETPEPAPEPVHETPEPAPEPGPETVPVAGTAERTGGSERQPVPDGRDADAGPAPAEPPLPVPLAGMTPTEAFDALYAHAAPALIRQTYVLTGRRGLSQESVERAFHLAWQHWPEVAVDRDPTGWVRVAAYDCALSPWQRLRSAHRHADEPLDDPARRALMQAVQELPPSYRRTLLLYDGVGLDLPGTAAETEASTPATVSRVLNAREAVAERLPSLAETAVLRDELRALVGAVPTPRLSPAGAVRTGCERRAEMCTRAVVAATALIVLATALALLTSPRQYEPPVPPSRQVEGVPPPHGGPQVLSGSPYSGPQQLSAKDLKLRDKLRAEPAAGPQRLLPQLR
ncbi:helix-turn-helix domain-containing protein [Streptomyces sp. PKU-EA00015]|uniref:helix-turn-helix domain-containing protein n=1 Tax=Streptomyces sp. PKU-EA00015 TaxID=2748326 RepID=UPI00159FF165|nr:helix-turn-helix domain-containing protein [Streptomyces sp. PKU-EA00015]NWF26191.1 helix-turn-helix domain-containing protein [Streptomyces sp. PKU-EA00015]